MRRIRHRDHDADLSRLAHLFPGPHASPRPAVRPDPPAADPSASDPPGLDSPPDPPAAEQQTEQKTEQKTPEPAVPSPERRAFESRASQRPHRDRPTASTMIPAVERPDDPSAPRPARTVPEETAGEERSPRRRRLLDLRSERLRRLHLDQPGARALVAVGLVAALIAGGYLWQSRPRSQPAAEVVAPSPAASPTALAGAAPAGVTVHVAGKVRRPGVVTLPSGARVVDAIRAAGGLRPGAETGTLNLARRVVDGEQIAVGVPAAPPEAAPPGTAGAPAAADSGQRLDLNTATVEQLDGLPGVGPVLAQRIVEYRTRNGGFRSVEQLREVTGIGERRYAELKDLVRV